MSEEKKTQVYLGVISLVQQGRSLNELKVSEIAVASGIGKGTCYEYFSSKEEIGSFKNSVGERKTETRKTQMSSRNGTHF